MDRPIRRAMPGKIGFAANVSASSAEPDWRGLLDPLWRCAVCNDLH